MSARLISRWVLASATMRALRAVLFLSGRVKLSGIEAAGTSLPIGAMAPSGVRTPLTARGTSPLRLTLPCRASAAHARGVWATAAEAAGAKPARPRAAVAAATATEADRLKKPGLLLPAQTRTWFETGAAIFPP